MWGFPLRYKKLSVSFKHFPKFSRSFKTSLDGNVEDQKCISKEHRRKCKGEDGGNRWEH